MLMQRNILKVIIVLFLAAQSELGAFIQMLCVSLSRNVHHNEIFSKVVKFISWAGTFHIVISVVYATGVHPKVAVVCSLSCSIDTSNHAICVNA